MRIHLSLGIFDAKFADSICRHGPEDKKNAVFVVQNILFITGKKLANLGTFFMTQRKTFQIVKTFISFKPKTYTKYKTFSHSAENSNSNLPGYDINASYPQEKWI